MKIGKKKFYKLPLHKASTERPLQTKHPQHSESNRLPLRKLLYIS